MKKKMHRGACKILNHQNNNSSNNTDKGKNQSNQKGKTHFLHSIFIIFFHAAGSFCNRHLDVIFLFENLDINALGNNGKNPVTIFDSVLD